MPHQFQVLYQEKTRTGFDDITDWLVNYTHERDEGLAEKEIFKYLDTSEGMFII
jgi:hypothetical protein